MKKKIICDAQLWRAFDKLSTLDVIAEKKIVPMSWNQKMNKIIFYITFVFFSLYFFCVLCVALLTIFTNTALRLLYERNFLFFFHYFSVRPSISSNEKLKRESNEKKHYNLFPHPIHKQRMCSELFGCDCISEILLACIFVCFFLDSLLLFCLKFSIQFHIQTHIFMSLLLLSFVHIFITITIS